MPLTRKDSLCRNKLCISRSLARRSIIGSALTLEMHQTAKGKRDECVEHL